MESHFIHIDGIRTHYLEAGDPIHPTVILLHGGGMDSSRLSWTPTIAALADEFHVIAPDWPGYGESGRPVAQYDLPYYVDFFTQFVETLAPQRPFSLGGISMGGGAAIGYALRHPENIRKLILVDSYGLQDKAPYHFLGYLFIKLPVVNELTWSFMRSRGMIRWSLGALLADSQTVTPDLVELAYEETQRPALGMAWRSFQKNEVMAGGTKTIYMDRLGEIDIPTLIIHGQKDTLVPMACSDEAQRRIPAARLEVIEGAGHWPQRDRPEVFNRLVEDFLRPQE